MIRLAYVVTHPASADTFLRGQLAFMRERGFDVTVVASPGPALERVRVREGVAVLAVPMEREISPAHDARSLVALTRALRDVRPDIVNASTPKAGLLGMIASRALGVRRRVYLLQGLRLETTRGALRSVLRGTERLAAACATDVVANSESLRQLAVREGLVPASKAKLVAASSNGVDAERWTRTDARVSEGKRRAREAGIDDRERVIGFVGRLHRDKGIADLLDAFTIVRKTRPARHVRLLLVGGDLAGDEDAALDARIRGAHEHGVVALGSTDDLAPLYARMDVLAFPSYREGFPNVPLEAAAASVPVAAYRATGTVDAVEHGVTGTLVGAGDVASLARAILAYLDDDALRRAHGEAGRARAVRSFSPRAVWEAWETWYRR